MKERIFVLAQLLIIGVLFFSVEAAFTESKKISQESSTGEIKISITADQVEFDSQNEIATYRGRVTVRQDEATLYADRIEVYLVEGGKKIELIKAYGNIKIVQEDKIITAQKGIYYHQGRKVILTGNPTTRQGGNWITGDKIIYFWDRGKALIEGNVNATIAVNEGEIGARKD